MYGIIFDVNPQKEISEKINTLYSDNYIPLVPDPHKFSSGGYGEIKYPYPITGGYNMAFDTSPSTHTLAVAQANGNGIMVYKFNPETEKLKLIWAPRLKE